MKVIKPRAPKLVLDKSQKRFAETESKEHSVKRICIEEGAAADKVQPITQGQIIIIKICLGLVQEILRAGTYPNKRGTRIKISQTLENNIFMGGQRTPKNIVNNRLFIWKDFGGPQRRVI